MNRLFEYALVILCFAFACGRRRGDLDGFMALLALLFTVGADFFLVALKEEQWLPGMGLFCCAQLCWALRLWGMVFSKITLLAMLTLTSSYSGS